MKELKDSFVILTFPRSGSYHLMDKLNSAKDIVCLGEIYKTDRVELNKAYLNGLGLTKSDCEKRNEMGIDFLFRLRAMNPGKIFGFKIFSGHVKFFEWFNELLYSESLKKVVLIRPYLYVYASLLRLRHTHIAAKKSDHDRDIEDPVVQFNKRSFEKSLRTYDSFMGRAVNLLHRCQDTVYLLRYEDINNADEMAKLLRFLGSGENPAALESKYVKQSTHRLDEAFENWDEMVAYIEKSGRSYLLKCD